MRITDPEWAVLEVLWNGEKLALGEVVDGLAPVNGWSRNTVFTYLTRMEKKGLVAIDRTEEKPYSAAVKREECAREERQDLLSRVYGGATGDLVAAFLKESTISPKERARLRKLLDEMEV
jgi:BlaI family penicillinase repressor